MKVLIQLLITITLFLVITPQQGFAKTYAYLIGTDGKAMKIDTDTDSVVSNLNLEKSSYVQSGENSVVADPNNKHLFVVVGRLGSKVLVYDLKTLRLIKDLGIYTPEPDITIFLTPDGKKVFVVWWNTKLEGGAWQFDIFDGITLERVKTLDFYFFPKQVTFSKDSSTLYAIEGGDWARIKVIDMATLKIASTIDLNTIWKTDGYLSGIEDYKYEKILIRETKIVTQDSSPEITYFVYDLKSKTLSPRISTVIAGEAKLSLDGVKIFIHDEESVWSEDKSYFMYHKSLGRLYVYDVATGKKWGFVQFTVDRDSDILGIHPNGNKVYMKGDIQGNRSLIVMDVVKLQVLKTLRISENILFMIFYEE